jgi:hypothetical protein
VWSASRPGRFTPRGKDPVTHYIGGWVSSSAGLEAVEKNTAPAGIDPRPLARIPSLYRLRNTITRDHIIWISVKIYITFTVYMVLLERYFLYRHTILGTAGVTVTLDSYSRSPGFNLGRDTGSRKAYHWFIQSLQGNAGIAPRLDHSRFSLSPYNRFSHVTILSIRRHRVYVLPVS